MIRFVFISFFLVSTRLNAFPEMVRHGYFNCTACHTSLVGGNSLNAYGRSLSKDVMSQKTFLDQKPKDGDELFLQGVLKTPEWLDVGGDIRLLQTFVENQQSSKGRFLIMQLELDFVARAYDWIDTFFSVGRMEPKKEDPAAKDFVYTPRLGIDFRLSPLDQTDQTHIRVGRFQPAFGINFAEHIFVTRTLLDFGPGQERIAAEFSWVSDHSSVILTAIVNQSGGNESKFEQGGILQYTRAVGEKSKIGFNIYDTQKKNNDERYSRSILGGFAYIGFTKEWYGLLEVDRPRGLDGKYGLVETFKLGKEVYQGLQVFATHEFANLDSSQGDPKLEIYGLGTEWFPIPHLDFYAAYRKEKNTAFSPQFQDVIWLIGHYYL